MREKESEFNNGYCFRNHTVCNRANKIGKRRARERKRAERVGGEKNRQTMENNPNDAANFELGIFDSPPPRFDTANGRAVPTVSRKPFLSFTIVHDVYRGAYIRRLVKRFSTYGSAKMLLCFYAITNFNILSMSRGK